MTARAMSKKTSAVHTDNMPRLAPVRDEYSPFSGPKYRVILLSRIHPDANRNAVELFFRGFRIVDYKRRHIAKTAKPANVAFVLFESVQERDRAIREKRDKKLMGRKIGLEVAT